jgi:hypothetical protein
MVKVVEDLKFGLTNGHAFFSPHNMARSSRALAEIGYKHSDLQSLWLSHLNQRLKEDNSTKYVSPPSFEQEIYGSMKNFDPRYHIFQGF